MNTLWRNHRIAALFVAALGLTACGGGDTPPPSASALSSGQVPVDFAQRVTLGLAFHPDPAGTLVTDGGVVSIQIENTGMVPLSVTDMQPIADDGLVVTYMGFSDCSQGCVGTARWDSSAESLATHSISGTYPITLDPVSRLLATNRPILRVVFRLTLDAAAVDHVRNGCLTLKAVRLTLSTGKRSTAKAFGNRAILGVWPEDHALPSGASQCRPAFS